VTQRLKLILAETALKSFTCYELLPMLSVAGSNFSNMKNIELYGEHRKHIVD
jgi:hypothetical protein